MRKLGVAELNRYVKLLLESSDALSGIWVTGEISDFKQNRSSGHAYFSLKEGQALVRAVCFRNAAAKLRFVPKDGMQVTVLGRVTLYEPDGRYQLIVEDILPEGVGAANRFLEQLRQRLQDEGLFAKERKRPLPLRPKHIALITASGSAALADIINVISRRNPMIKLTVFPVAVQGLQSETSIVRAVAAAGRAGCFDLVIIARGGGSREDLHAFNSEAVVRAAVLLPVPFVSAVGHETDISLLDFAADLRAATPSVAAELSVPDISLRIEALERLRRGIPELLSRQTEERRRALREAGQAVRAAAEDGKNRRREALAALGGAADSGVTEKLRGLMADITLAAERLRGLDPMLMFTRGCVYAEKDGLPLRSAAMLREKETLRLLFADGEAECGVKTVWMAKRV